MKYFLFNLLFPITYSFLQNGIKISNKKDVTFQKQLPSNILQDTQNVLPLTKVIIHKGYGAFGLFSNKFEKEFKNTYTVDLQSLLLYDPYHDKMNSNKYIDTRYDIRIISLFEKLGRHASNDGLQSMCIVCIPTELIKDFYINEYDGAEWIWCNISKKYKELLFSIMKSDGKITDMFLNKIYLIKRCEKYLIDNNIHFV
jgi:hypothetical protein